VEDVGTGGGSGSGSASSDGAACAEFGVTNDGECVLGGDTALWCDAEIGIVQWDCGSEGLKCMVDDCGPGAYCCDPSPATDECPALGEKGACDGNVARWCDGDQLRGDVCRDWQTCDVDPEGWAMCFDNPGECSALGFAGTCSAQGNVLFCDSNGEIAEVECAANEFCAQNDSDCVVAGEFVACCKAF
jgi:hypothetical protein